MDRLDMELYADRVSRHAERLDDDLAAARLRLAWVAFEATARERLGPDDALLLESVGVLGGTATDDDERTVTRRHRQLVAVGRLQAIVEETLAALRPTRG
jgi:hypothetical protein